MNEVVFIGAGNLATQLARAMYAAGFHICQVYSRTQESAATLADAVQATYTTSLAEVVTHADLYIVALKDDALLQLLPRITAGKQQALLVHTAGSIPMDIWHPHAQRYGVLYPMQTFSKHREVNFQEVSFFVEAVHRDDAEQLKQVASRLSPKVYEATSEQRKSLHLAAVFACNFVNHMYTQSARLLSKYHLPFDAMLPLIDETARKVHHLPPYEAQTGPAIRNDEQVMTEHLRMLEDDPEAQELYRLISKNIQGTHRDS